MTTTEPLPRVSVYIDTDAGDSRQAILLAQFFGDGAVKRAEDFITDVLSGLPPDHPDRERYSIDVSDDQCANCGETFSSEARVEHVEGGWVCPACGGDPKP